MKTQAKQVCFSLSPDVHENFKKIAIISGNTQSNLANEVLKRFNNTQKALIQQYNEKFNFTPQNIQW